MTDYIVIQLSKTGNETTKYEALLSTEDAILSETNWSVVYRSETQIYAQSHRRKEKPTSLFLHRAVMQQKLGRKLDRKEHVDHINGNGLDCRRENLRLATQQQNRMNQRKGLNKTSQFKGVSKPKNRKRWQAHIRINGKTEYLGSFDTEQEAHKAYCNKSLELYGEYANDGNGQIITD